MNIRYCRKFNHEYSLLYLSMKNNYSINNINSVIEKSTYTVEKLAVKCDIARSTLSGYLKGQRIFPIDKFITVCRVLDVRPCEILEKDFKHGQEFSNFPKTEPKIKIGGEKIGGYLHGEKEALYENQVGFLQNQLKEKDKQIAMILESFGGAKSKVG